ncbi:MAG: ribbon-helix-helix protein, CopG family [Solirubrobacterales bacterium]
MSLKITSLRLDEELATELKAVARAEGVPVSEAIRAALYQYIATCRADPGFQARFQKQLEDEREALERLANWGKGGAGEEN